MERQKTGLSRSYCTTRHGARLRQTQHQQRVSEQHRHDAILHQQQFEEPGYFIVGPHTLEPKEAPADVLSAVAKKTQ